MVPIGTPVGGGGAAVGSTSGGARRPAASGGASGAASSAGAGSCPGSAGVRAAVVMILFHNFSPVIYNFILN